MKALKNKSNPQSDNNYHMLDIMMNQYVTKEKISKKLKKSSKIELNKLMIGTQTRKIKIKSFSLTKLYFLTER